jgi:hypothetical protein
LITFITHPDYLIERRARAVYHDLLDYLGRLCSQRNIWMAVPGEVDRWWRERSEMRVVADGAQWRIEGPGSDRARLAFAVVENDSVVYELASANRMAGEDVARYEAYSQ